MKKNWEYLETRKFILSHSNQMTLERRNHSSNVENIYYLTIHELLSQPFNNIFTCLYGSIAL